MIRMLLLTTVFLCSCTSSVGEFQASYIDRKCVSREPCRMPISTLLANIDGLVGKRVSLSGYLVSTDTGFYLYDNVFSAEADAYNSTIRIDGVNAEVFRAGLVENGGSNATVTGTVLRKDGQGWAGRGWAILSVSEQPRLFAKVSYAKSPPNP